MNNGNIITDNIIQKFLIYLLLIIQTSVFIYTHLLCLYITILMVRISSKKCLVVISFFDKINIERLNPTHFYLSVYFILSGLSFKNFPHPPLRLELFEVLPFVEKAALLLKW